MRPDQEDITRLLREWTRGDQNSLDRLLPLVYGELKRLARHHLSRLRPGETLQPTSLVHEAYLRLARADVEAFASRSHFFAFASRLMRSVLVDHARAQGSAKRGGDAPRVALEEAIGVADSGVGDPDTLLAIDEALHRLRELDPRQCRIAELRLFGGLTQPEIATVLGVSRATVERGWAVASRWLAREIQGGTV